ncbi:NAD(P)-dependent oxidoreductase [Spirosoma spitsbergense]|uniref:NAD(P)-dependent oxidoreductase n=1 Tax=Spirosoma spitsbergense TaxID=431554 RepID=UPI00037F1AE1|nr:NAD(P)-dependent oxidoreductase [Spirosoma spitsbergense]
MAKQHIGLIGLGSMGTPLAYNLLAAGYPLTVYNRTAEKVKPLVEKGAKQADKSEDVAQPGGLVITMLSNDEAVKEVAMNDAFASRLGKGGIHLSMSTISPDTARQLAEHHARFGVLYVAAPVLGRPQAIADRKAWACVSGEASAREVAKPILLAGAVQSVYDFGDEPAAANVVKLAGNFLIASAIEAMSEAMTVAGKSGIDRQTLLNLLTETIFPSPIYKNYGQTIIDRTYDKPGGFRLPLGLKDMNLVLQLASEAETPMPLAQLLQNRLQTAVAKGRTDWDWTGLAAGAADDAGL